MTKLTDQEEESLKQDNLLWQMSETDGFKLILRPWLMEKLTQAFPDPAQFTKEEEFVYAAKLTSVYKKVVAELLQFIDMKVEEAKILDERKRSRKPDPFEIGR